MLGFSRAHKDESGISVLESVVAAMIILIVMTFGVVTVLETSKAQTFANNMAKATELTSQQFAIAKSLPYKQLGIEDASLRAPITDPFIIDCDAWQSTINGEPLVLIASAPASGLTYCSQKKYDNAGITFTIQTTVSLVDNDGFNRSVTESLTTSASQPKRVNVKIMWTEENDNLGAAQIMSYSAFTIIYPPIGECPPLNAVFDGSNPITYESIHCGGATLE